jgi:hypothetical protein
MYEFIFKCQLALLCFIAEVAETKMERDKFNHSIQPWQISFLWKLVVVRCPKSAEPTHWK